MAGVTRTSRATTARPRRRSHPLSLQQFEVRIGRALLYGALLLGYVLVANLLAGQLSRGYRLDIGTRPDRTLVAGFHGNERDSSGESYRWTDGDATLTLRGPATRDPAIVAVELGWLPPEAEVPRRVYASLDAAPWAQGAVPNEPRQYQVLLPPEALSDGELQLNLRTDSNTVGGDPRRVGLRVDAVELRWPGERWPLAAPAALLAQAGLAGAWLVAARRARVPRGWAVAGAAALVAALALTAALQPAVAAPWLLQLAGAGVATAGIVWWGSSALPRVDPQASDRFVRALLLITLAALAIRLVGVLYPTFIAHDFLVNSGRLRKVQLGDLTLFDRPSEFSRNVAVVSPIVFLMAAPLSLVGDRELALQGLYAVLDGTTPLLVGLLARRLGLGPRASLLAAGLIALLPMHLTALYWGFVKQIVGQWLTLLLLLVAASPAPRRPAGWVAAGTLAAVTLLIHPGGLLLAGVCLGLWVLWGGGLALREERADGMALGEALLRGARLAPWRGWFLTLAATVVAILAIQYADAIRLMIGGLLDGSTAPDAANQQTDQAARLLQIWIGLNASFDPLPLALVAAGLAALLYRSAGAPRLLAAAWAISAALFLAVDIVTGQQVRYGYFIAPLACCGVAALIEPVLGRRLGRAAAWALVALVMLAGASLWLDAAFAGVKPSVNSLTH